MIIGENVPWPDEMVVNPTKAKQLTNIRTHAADEAIKLTPARRRAHPGDWPSSGSPTTSWSR
jgi:predicted membrane GTPase involved in stress response